MQTARHIEPNSRYGQEGETLYLLLRITTPVMKRRSGFGCRWTAAHRPPWQSRRGRRSRWPTSPAPAPWTATHEEQRGPACLTSYDTPLRLLAWDVDGFKLKGEIWLIPWTQLVQQWEAGEQRHYKLTFCFLNHLPKTESSYRPKCVTHEMTTTCAFQKD